MCYSCVIRLNPWPPLLFSFLLEKKIPIAFTVNNWIKSNIQIQNIRAKTIYKVKVLPSYLIMWPMIHFKAALNGCCHFGSSSRSCKHNINVSSCDGKHVSTHGATLAFFFFCHFHFGSVLVSINSSGKYLTVKLLNAPLCWQASH